jgi:hypothetical protein
MIKLKSFFGKNRPVSLIIAGAFLLLLPVCAGAQRQIAAASTTAPAGIGKTAVNGTRPTLKPKESFPEVFFTEKLDALKAWDESRPFWAASLRESAQETPDRSMLLDYSILAYYGHPNSRVMGILGRYTKEALNESLSQLAKQYEAAGAKPIRKAFYIIYGTVWPEGNIGIINKSILEQYITFAQENDILIFLDHQIGKYDPISSLKAMLPYLKYPNVHLALDPEWRTKKPMVETGYLSGEEINQAQQIMQDYIIANNIPGERMLVIHQFKASMISRRDEVKSDFERVRLVHCADGFGNPALKKYAYRQNAQAQNIPVKGFKLFYNSGIPNTGYDEPLLKPAEVLALDPSPYVIMYQ